MRGPLILGLDDGKPSYFQYCLASNLILGKRFSKISTDFSFDLGAKEVTSSWNSPNFDANDDEVDEFNRHT